MNIVYDNITATIENPSDGVKAMLLDALKYHPDGYEHVYSYKSKKWDGYNLLYNAKDNSFRAGLLNRVAKLLENSGIGVTKHYTGKPSPYVAHRLRLGVIRPYDFQHKVTDVVRVNPIGIIVSPTGSGKTAMIALAINEICRRTIILVTDVVLLDQMQQSMQKYFDQPIGIIGDGEFDLQDITVATVQSISSITKAKSVNTATKRKLLLSHLQHAGAIISDEVHLYDSDGVSEIMPNFIYADHFYGMSATPYGWGIKSEKKSNLELEQHFGNVIYDCRKLNFIELGLKVPIFVNVINRQAINKEYKKHMKRGFYGGAPVPDWTKNYKDCLNTELLESEQYHKEIAKHAWDLAVDGVSAFVHASHSIAFGEKIKDLIPGAVFVNGSTPRLERREVYEAMRKKELLTLVSDVGATGLDIPSLGAIMLASDLKDIRQLSGRVGRASPGKSAGIILDFRTQCMFLEKHHAIRRSQYEHDNNIIIES